MVMIRCPECGQRVLDVASSCPRCGHILLQNPLETHDWGALQTCGRCGKHIERNLTICPYCGHHVRAARVAGQVALATASVAVVVVAAVLLGRSGLLGALRETARSSRRPEAAAQRPPESAPGPSLPAPDSVRAAPITAATPDSVAPAAPARPTVRAPDALVPRAGDLVTRWTLEWANVRAARSMESSVVQVLPPGQAVEVREMRQGWWAVHARGAVVGYIANSVLTTVPPG
jgi:DNA-directed RNA polymerase subunit RPC12/RpoP